MSSKTKEGKTLRAPSARSCENCNETDSAYYCPQCNMDLCVRCEQFHSKSNLTKDHRVVSSEKRVYESGSTFSHSESYDTHAKAYRVDSSAERVNVPVRTLSQTVSCDTHIGQPLQFVCENCIVSLCSTCKATHPGHDIIEVDRDVGSVQRLCLQGVPQLMGLVEQLKISDGTSKSHQEVRALVVQQRDYIQSVIKRESDRLLNDIDREIENDDTRAKDRNDEVEQYATRTEKIIDDLTEMRIVTDPGILLAAINSYHSTESEVKHFLAAHGNQHLSIEQMLPNIGLIRGMEKTFQTAFTLTKEISCDLNIRDLKEYFHEKLQRQDHEYYRLSERKMSDFDKIIVFRFRSRKIYVLDLQTMKMKKYKCEKNIFHMITLAPDQHIMTDCEEGSLNRTGLHLLDDKFCVLYSMPPSIIRPQNSPAALCVESDNTFILRESPPLNSKNKHMFHRVVVANNRFLFTSIGELAQPLNIKFASMGYNSFTNTLTMLEEETSICCVQLTDMTYKRYRLPSTFKVACSVYVDTNQTYLGDMEGSVMALTAAGKYQYSVKLGRVRMSGIARRSDKFIVVVDGKLIMYK